MPSATRPVRPRPTRRPKVIVVGTLIALGISAALVWAVVRFASENPDKANLGDPIFNIGQATRLSKEIDKRGPFLFQDPLSLGRGRNLYVQHLGTDITKGWSAIEARLPNDPACGVTWVRSRETFVDCHDEQHPPDGTGLTTYRGTVLNGRVRVDLRTS